MNHIAEENENQEMNTEELETQDVDIEARETELDTEEESSAPEEVNALSPETEITGEETMEELLGIYESSLKKFEEGQVVTGTVISVGRDMVLVDVGYKSEGRISIQEFIDEKGNVNVKVGDQFEVMIEVWDEEEETVLLSRDKAKKVKVWDAIKDIYDADGTIEGVITNRVKGGFSVDIGLQAFLPGSQADLRPIRNMDEMVNKTYEFKILKYNKRRNNIVLSRRFCWKRNGKNCGPLPWKPLKTTRSWKGLSRISRNTGFSWIWAVWTVCCISPTFPGAVSSIRQNFTQWATKSQSKFCPMISKRSVCLWA